MDEGGDGCVLDGCVLVVGQVRTPLIIDSRLIEDEAVPRPSSEPFLHLGSIARVLLCPVP